jgi:THO complex subunit 5
MTIGTTPITDTALQNCLDVAEKTRRLCHEIVSAIENAPEIDQSEHVLVDRSRKQKQLNALVAQLKGLHRSAIMASRDVKEGTAESRREVDRLHLQLQNLYYEQRHLRGEITACREFSLVPPFFSV